MRKLELVREEKLFKLLPGRTKASRLEASGVAMLNATTALVVFDNFNQVARVNVSLEPSSKNGIWPAPSLGAGFEDIAADTTRGSWFALVESVEDFDGVLRGFVAEYDRRGHLRQCARLPGRFVKANKGFEGLAHTRRNGREYLFALREANVRTSRGQRGRIDVYVRTGRAVWKESHHIELPGQARFKDYSGLAYRDHRIAIVSQESARLWVARLDPKTLKLVPASGAVYKFPGRHYRNVEGIDWLSDDTVIAVSDRMKKGQPAKCGKNDQSVHVFRIPETSRPSTDSRK